MGGGVYFSQRAARALVIVNHTARLMSSKVATLHNHIPTHPEFVIVTKAITDNKNKLNKSQ